MAVEDEVKPDAEDKAPDEQIDAGIDFVTLGMFIIGKRPVDLMCLLAFHILLLHNIPMLSTHVEGASMYCGRSCRRDLIHPDKGHLHSTTLAAGGHIRAIVPFVPADHVVSWTPNASPHDSNHGAS